MVLLKNGENSPETKHEKRNSHGNKHEANTSYAALTAVLASS